MTVSSATPRRAIWGLVNDGYALVAKTANLTHDEAFELCRVPDIGDPSAYLDFGIAYLQAPKWGHVFARYFTNAERDSAGRASLVYDVVALSDADFAALGNDPFSALPPLSTDRRPERFGELTLPTPARRSDEDEADRVSTLLQREDHATITALLGALLAGDRVLCVASGIRSETIECLTLLLPPSLRTLLTFQVPTVDFPKHVPRLTVAERAQALLVERDWTGVLPRDADARELAETMVTARMLVALGVSSPARLRRAWTVDLAGPASPKGAAHSAGAVDLGVAVAGMLRMDQLHEALRAGDVRRAVLVAGRAESADERARVSNAMFDHYAPDAVAAALADVVRGEQRGAWAAVQSVVSTVVATREQDAERFASFFTTLIDGLRSVPQPTDAAARGVLVTLACGAAAIDDLDRFLEVADPTLPWETAWRDGCARWVKGRSAVARVFDALAAKGATYGDAIDGIQAIGTVSAKATGRSRDRASGLGLALVRRTLRERAMLEPPDRLGALVGGLMHIWSADGTPADEVDRTLRRFLGVGEPSAGGHDARRIAADLSRTIADAPEGGETELLGWVVAALERANAGVVGDATVRVVTALLEEQRRLAPRPEFAAHVGRVLLHFATTDAAFVFRQAWLDVARQVDDSSRRELLVRALAWVARGYANGKFTVGAFADACVAAGREDATIDDATVELLVPHLAAAVTARGSSTELGVLAATLASVATPSAAERLTTVLLGAADDVVADTVRMRRLALALQEIERVRDEDRYGEARAALRRVLARQAISADEERALRVFLGVDDGTMMGRLLGRLPNLTPRANVATGDRR